VFEKRIRKYAEIDDKQLAIFKPREGTTDAMFVARETWTKGKII